LDKVVQQTFTCHQWHWFNDFTAYTARYFKNEFPSKNNGGRTLPQEALVKVSVVAFKDKQKKAFRSEKMANIFSGVCS